jgi:predicted DNA-binding protein
MNVDIHLKKTDNSKLVLSVRIDAETKKKLDYLCKHYDLSQADAISQMIEIAYQKTRKQ